MDTFLLKIITPTRVLFNQQVYSVSVQTKTGEITLLKNHVNLFSVLKPGIIKVKLDSNRHQEFFLFGGILFFDNAQNTLLILADEAKTPTKELIKEIESAIKLAKQGKSYGIKVPVDALIKAEKELRAKFIGRKGF